MSEHKATPEQWEVVGLCQEEGKIPWATATCLLELRARVEALEAQVSGLQSCHNTTADHLLDIMAMVRGTASAEAKPAPAGSLVERLRDAVYKQSGRDPTSGEMCAAIREVAAWLREAGDEFPDGVALLLEQEANRG